MENFEDIPMVSQPVDLKINLFPHQLASVYMMEELESTHCVVNGGEKTFTDIGINGDMTGYGKTLSMIALIIRDRMEWDLEIPHINEIVESHCSNHVKKYINRMYTKNNTTLILAGPSVVHQWMKEFSYSDLAVFDGTNKKNALNFHVDDYDVVIVSIKTYNMVIEKYHGMAWKRFIYDEPTTLKVPSMKNIIAGFTWFLTATPAAISIHRSSRRSYMYSIVDDSFFNEISRTITVKNNDDFVRLSFTMPSTTHHYHNCYVPTFSTVSGIVSDRILKMIEGGNISGAIEALGGKNTDNIVDLVRKNKEIELEEIRSKIKIWNIRGDVEKIEEWNCKEKSIINQLEELDNRFGKILEENCSICFNKLDKPVMETGCQNIFCGACLLTWLKTKGSCPLCRKVISRDNLIYINKDKFLKMEEEKKNSTKEETIIKIFKNNRNGRFIIFSDWDESFDVIRELLRCNNISFVEVKGSINIRTRNIERFRNGDVNVVFLNSRTDSSGINMQETTDIILYHTMNEGTTKQIIGRANRIGRKLPLAVHHLVSV